MVGVKPYLCEWAEEKGSSLSRDVSYMLKM